MYCSRCGVENADGADVCSGCGFILAESSAAPPAGTVEGKTSRLAITSFVLGMLSLVCAILTGIPAIICGIISLVKISKSQGRLKGNGYAIAGIAVPAVHTLVILPAIIAMMATTAVPVMRGRIDAAKWSEGKAIMGTIATAIRAYVAENGEDMANFDEIAEPAALGFAAGDLNGTYFSEGDFSWTGNYNVSTNVLTFSIVAEAPAEINSPQQVTLNQDGEWGETP